MKRSLMFVLFFGGLVTAMAAENGGGNVATVNTVTASQLRVQQAATARRHRFSFSFKYGFNDPATVMPTALEASHATPASATCVYGIGNGCPDTGKPIQAFPPTK